ncbi:MAG: hypothetical protein IJD55_05720 [Clostridia bacterium]|nr:hypothetical protein [Clostridia bacterium]
MITLSALKDQTQIRKLFQKNGIEISENSGCLTASDGENILGYCLYELDEKKINILYLEPQKDLSLADGILRSTLHLATEKSIMTAFYSKKAPEDLFYKLNFIKDPENKTLDTDKLFKSCVSCK